MSAFDGDERQAALHALGHLLKQLRTADDLTQEELAERAGVSVRSISDLERGTWRLPGATRCSSLPMTCACAAPSASGSSPWRGNVQRPSPRRLPRTASHGARSPTRQRQSSAAPRRRQPRRSRQPPGVVRRAGGAGRTQAARGAAAPLVLPAGHRARQPPRRPQLGHRPGPRRACPARGRGALPLLGAPRALRGRAPLAGAGSRARSRRRLDSARQRPRRARGDELLPGRLRPRRDALAGVAGPLSRARPHDRRGVLLRQPRSRRRRAGGLSARSPATSGRWPTGAP